MSTIAQNSRQMPRYQCHKKVWALKIKAITQEVACCENAVVNGVRLACGEPKSAHTPEAARGDVGLDHDFIGGTFDVPGAIITPEDAGYAPFAVSEEYIDKHNPQPGGYFVVYDDGYQSFSPAKAFEEGYTPI